MAEILYAPDKERVITTNAWAFLHWLRTVHSIDLADWRALYRWSVADAGGFRVALGEFAPASPHPPRPQGWRGDVRRALADVLLHADIRPDDRLLVFGPAWPWIIAENTGAVVIQAESGDPLMAAAKQKASVLVASAQALGEAAFRRAGGRPDLAPLRTILATGGPLSPEARRRIYIWVKSDLMLLARTGDSYWGNPLEPVLVQPPPTPAFLTPRPSAPATG